MIDGAEVVSDDKLREILAGCQGVTPGPWEADVTRNDGDYGSGDEVHSGFESYQVLAEVRGQSAAVVDTINASHLITEVAEEYDEDGHSAWDEQGRKNAAHIARLDPATVSNIIADYLRLREFERRAVPDGASDGVPDWQAMFFWPDAKRRLWFISDRIAKGSLNRSDLCEAFGISVPQASADIGAWMKAHPGEAVYDQTAKCYVRAILRGA